MLTLYTAPTGNGRKPTLLLNLLDVDYKLHLFDWPTTDIKQEWYLKLNPNGTIPTLVDDERNLVLYESNAIVQYIIETFDQEGKYSFPKETNVNNYYLQQQWLFYQASNFASGVLYHTLVYSSQNPNDEWSRDYFLTHWNKIYTVLEGHLKNNKYGDQYYFIGDKFSVVDFLFAIGNHRRIEKTKGTNYEIDDFKTKFPTVLKWYDNIVQIEKVNQILS